MMTCKNKNRLLKNYFGEDNWLRIDPCTPAVVALLSKKISLLTRKNNLSVSSRRRVRYNIMKPTVSSQFECLYITKKEYGSNDTLC